MGRDRYAARMTERTISKVIGDRARQLRLEAGATLDDVAVAARRYGAQWTHSRIRKLEAGDNALTVDSLLILAAALSAVSDGDVQLATLIDDGSDTPRPLDEHLVQLSPSYSTLIQDVAGWFMGNPVDPTQVVVTTKKTGWGRSDFKWQWILSRQLRQNPAAMEMTESAFIDSSMTWLAAAGLAEERAAASLTVNLGALTGHSVSLWGTSLSAERDRRAELWSQQSGVPASAQKRGQITRDLLRELRTSIESDGKGN